MKKIILLVFCIHLCTISFGTRWIIGHGQTYTKPSEIVNLISDTDTIYIAPGVYEQDACKWKNKNLVFVGMGTSMWKTTFKYTGNIPNGKGIWVFENPGMNDNIEIQNIDFEGAQVSDEYGGNGAGIRFQAKNLILRNVGFRNCQNGLLEGHGAVTGSNVEIYSCEFYNNGYQEENGQHSGYEHNIYISASADTFYVDNSYFHHPRGQGNSLKTRALNSFILYNMFDEEDGNGSYEINIAQGGNNIIMGNVIIQGTSGSNHAIVGYDDITNPINEFYFINNTVINKFPGNNRYFHISPSSGISTFKIYNNIFASVPAAGNSFITGNIPQSLDTAGNYFADNYLDINFNDAANNDFSIPANASELRDKGKNAGFTIGGFELLPLQSYFRHYDLPVNRTVYGNAIDIGAYEYIFVSKTRSNDADKFDISPNPSAGQFKISGKNISSHPIKILDINGNEIKFRTISSTTDNVELIVENKASGLYFIVLNDGKNQLCKKLILL